jgi:iron complex outermembrane receptor protein
MRASRWNWVVAFALTMGFAMPLAAQTGTVSGKVTEKLEGRPVASANVQLIAAGGRSVAAAVTAADGGYRLSAAAGTYTLQVIALGFQSVRVSGVAVRAGTTVTQDVSLEARVVQLEAVTTTVSRQAEKTTEAPAAITVVPTVEITDRPALNVTDHVKALPGVDASTGGLVQANVVGRGFNNIFSGALLMLIDNRFAAVPSLRVNVPAFFTATDQDIEKVEFVLGPGAALYGPNSANGVLAITTKSPFESKGTTFALESGFRSTSRDADGESLGDGAEPYYRIGFRHASAWSKVGFKLSGEYLSGQEWRMRDPAEPASLPNRDCTPEFGCRNFDIEKWNFDGRIDWRPSEGTQLTLNGGWSNAANLIEYTGIGAGQAQDWGYKYMQARLRTGKLFVQGFANFSDAGNEDANDLTGTYLFRSGGPIVDQSRVWAAQAQHSLDLGSKQTFTYGIDYAYTDARTGGTINGRNEDDDNITEVGGYIYSQTRLSPKLDLIAALRADKHSALEDLNWSPRAAIVFKPTEDQALRFTYNRAFSTPSNNNLFLDIVAASIPLGGGLKYDVRALGVPGGGFSFRNYCGTGGVDDLCMRTPFPVPGLSGVAFPVQASTMWKVGIAAVSPALIQAGVPAQILQILGAAQPTATQVGTQLRRLDPTRGVFDNVTSASVADIPDLKPTISNVLEAGYKGTFGQKFRFEAAGWFEKRENFVGPLLVESPNVFFDAASTGSYIAQVLGQAGVPPQQIAALAPLLTCVLAGPKVAGCTQPGVPLGTVVPNSDLTQNADMFLTYRNFGAVDLWGVDLSATYLIGNEWSVAGAYSHVNKDFFTAQEVEGPTDVALNAPMNKGALSVQYAKGLNGFAGEVRGRFVQGFPVNSGVYTTPTVSGCTDAATCEREDINDYNVVDVTASYRFKWGLMASASIQNLFNKNYQTFAGLPYLGRLVMTRLTYTF